MAFCYYFLSLQWGEAGEEGGGKNPQLGHLAVLEITIGHWLFFNHLTNKNSFCLAKLTVHF